MRHLMKAIPALLLVFTNTLAQTIIPGGDVYGTWTVSGSPYIVMGDITIPVSQTLTVEPGVEVRFDQDLGLTIYGELSAVGISGDLITFTSDLPDPQMGDWSGFEVLDTGTCLLTYAIMEYAVIWGEYDNLHNYITITNSTIGPITCSGYDMTLTSSVVEGDIHSLGDWAHYLTLNDCDVTGNLYAGSSEFNCTSSLIDGDITLGYTRDTSISGNTILGSISGGISYIGGSYGISGNTLDGGGISINHSSEVSGSITGNNVDGGGISISHTGHPSMGGSATISDNIVSNSPSTGLSITSSGNDSYFYAYIENNVVSNAGGHAIYVEGREGGGIFSPFSAGITGNTITTAAASGILIERYDLVEVTGNSIAGVNDDGVHLNDIASNYRDIQIEVTDNDLQNVDRGVHLDETIFSYTVYDVIIDFSDNVILNAGSAGLSVTNLQGTDKTVTMQYNAITTGASYGMVIEDADMLSIVNNSLAGGGIQITGSGSGTSYATLINNIVSEGSDYGVTCSGFASSNASYNDVWDFTSGEYAGITPGSGSISLDPCFVDIANGDLNLQRVSPCIDTGDPAFPLDPDNTRADMGALYFHQSMPVKLTLIPASSPIIIPASGGSFDFAIQVTNRTMTVQPFDLWTEIELPGWGSFEIMSFTGLSIAVDDTVTRNRTQSVPDFAPAGTYTYLAYVGDYPWIVDDYYYFYFEKEGIDQRGTLGTNTDWPCSGEGFAPWRSECDKAAYTFALHAASPNPFNPSTVVSFTLQAASRVKLAVYDITGSKVADLVDGWRDAGQHDVTFDGTSLASGLYIYRLQAGEFIAQGKMVLVK